VISVSARVLHIGYIAIMNFSEPVYFWGVECTCGNFIPLKITTETGEKPQLKERKAAFTIFCPHCGEIWCRADQVDKRRGPLPDDFWPRSDLFDSNAVA